MHDPRTTICALNNADWCRLICGAHGIESVQHSTHWECLGRPPRYYPSAVTLGPSRETPENLRIGSPEFLGIKDSFCCLDMAPYGMHVVLKAEWIWRDAGPAPASGLTWAMVQNDDELLAWEAAWAKDDEDAKNHPRQFPASLLNDPECRFIQVCAGDQLVGGGALNLASRVVGGPEPPQGSRLAVNRHCECGKTYS